MSVPPRTPREQTGWDVPGEQPTPDAPHGTSEKLGRRLLGILLLVVVVAAVLLIVL